jgi:glycosyltransferase involved in cell wall biosynthesis
VIAANDAVNPNSGYSLVSLLESSGTILGLAFQNETMLDATSGRGPNTSFRASRTISALQVGGGWFPEEAGGLNRFYYDLLHHLPEAGVQCRGLVAGLSDRWPELEGVEVRAFESLVVPLRKRWAAEWKMACEEISHCDFDLIVSHFAPYAVPVYSKVSNKRPLVTHFQGPWARESREEGKSRLGCIAKGLIERLVYRRAHRLIVLSTPFKKLLTSEFGVNPDLVRVVPGGVDCDRFNISETRNEARARLDWPTDRPIVLAVRRLARRMGLENLIEAVEAVRREVPEMLLLIAGGGHERDRLREVIRTRGLDQSVRLLGFVPDDVLPLAYRAADLSVVPTVSLEGFGLVAAESLSAGTPVVATPVDGLVELLQPLSPDLLFQNSSPASIADGLIGALTGAIKLPDADRCSSYARRRFGWNVIAAAVADVYREVVGA